MRSLIFAVFSAALCPSAAALLLKALSRSLSRLFLAQPPGRYRINLRHQNTTYHTLSRDVIIRARRASGSTAALCAWAWSADRARMAVAAGAAGSSIPVLFS